MKNLIPWQKKKKPNILVPNLLEDIDRFWEPEFYQNFFSGNNSFSPSIDVHNGEKSITVKAEVPGMDADDISVTFQDGYVLIKGEKKDEHCDKKDKNGRYECSYGYFSRQFYVGDRDHVDWDNVKAEYKKGVLKLDIPKKKTEAKSVKIRVD